MRIEPLLVTRKDAEIWVRFRCSIGEGSAIWAGCEVPSRGTPIDVEFDINRSITLGVNAKLNDSRLCRMIDGESIVTLTGFIEAQDKDGMAYLRLSEDCLIMVESMDMDLKGKWIELEVAVRSFLITPIGC